MVKLGALHYFSTKNSSTATYTYETPGQYAITVYVSNPMYKTPVKARLPYELVVVEALDADTLHIHQISSFGAAPLRKDARGNYSTGTIIFEAT